MTPFESFDDRTNFDYFMQSLGFTPDIGYGQQSPPLPDFIALPGFRVLPGFNMFDQDGQSIPSGTAALSEIGNVDGAAALSEFGNVDPTEREIEPNIVIPTERANLGKVVASTEKAIPAKFVIPIESAMTNPVESTADANATERAVVIQNKTNQKKPTKERHHTLHVSY
jgi:hypothetical protein